MPRITLQNLQTLQSSKDISELINNLNRVLIPAIEGNFTKINRALEPVSSLQKLVAADTIKHETPLIQIQGKHAAITSTSTPTISDGYDGEKITVVGQSDTNTVRLQDENELSGSNLKFAFMIGRTLGVGNSVDFIFSETTGFWHERIPF